MNGADDGVIDRSGETDSRGTDTVRICLLTPPGRGALAVVGVWGPDAVDLVDRSFTSRGGPVQRRPNGAIAVGRWTAMGGHAGEELVVVRHAVDRIEVHCHGGTAAPEAVIAALVAQGARRKAWQEWPGSDSSIVAREARAAMVDARGPRAARILCRQLAGSLDREMNRIALLRTAGDEAAAGSAVETLLRAARVGLRLARPWRVVLAGAVNAGKSSLVNALAGHARSLVAGSPGTTRDTVEVRIVLGGWEIDLVDVAGTRDDGSGVPAVERDGIARAEAARAAADLVLHVVSADACAMPAALLPHDLLVLSKADLAAPARAVPKGAVATSALTGAGIELLGARIVERLVPEDLVDPDLLAGAVPFTERQVEALHACR